MKRRILAIALAFSMAAVGPAWAALEILSVSKPVPNAECQTATGKVTAVGIELRLSKGAGDTYTLTIPAWNPDTLEPWTKGELNIYITAHSVHYEEVAVPEPEPDLTLFDGYTMDTPTMKAFVKLLIKEINILRASHGLPDRTWEQFMTALRVELEEE